MKKWTRTALSSLANVGGWFVFAAGLISPLTPSYGTPSIIELLIFLGGPVLLLVVGGYLSVTKVGKWFAAVQIVVLACVAAYVLYPQYRGS